MSMIAPWKTVGHRGYAARYPENTLPGFEAALALGVDAVELDVQLSADGHVIVIHDADVLRTAGEQANVLENTFDELRQYSCHYPEKFQAQFAPLPVDSLKHVSERLAQLGARVFIEIKQESIPLLGREEYLRRVLSTSAALGENRFIISFDYAILSLAKSQCDLPVGWCLEEMNEAEHNRAKHLSPDILICSAEHVEVLTPESLWSGEWQWFVYGIESYAQAQAWYENGAHWIEADDPQAVMKNTEKSAVDDTVDLVVLGAGIQGAGVAQAAAAAGYSVVVLEKAEAAAKGTSSKSSKLIHGGLRYLETLQLTLVRECLREKERLCQIAPSLVKPARFIVPVYKAYKRSPFWVQLGLLLYRALAWPAKNTVRGRYAKRHWAEHDRLLPRGLRALFEYEDAQTDDAKLTEAVLHSASELGAQVYFKQTVLEITVLPQGGFKLKREGEPALFTRTLVNATGPWVNKTAALIKSSQVPTMPVDLVQGAHIVLNRPAMQCCYYIESPDDGRAMFVLPWKGNVMVGTTEYDYVGKPENCFATEGEIAYLLKAFNHYFPSMAASAADICDQFAGLRVLPKDNTSNNKRSRDTLFLQSSELPGYLSIYGGKLTAYRLSAEKVVRKLRAFLPVRTRRAHTDQLELRLPER